MTIKIVAPPERKHSVWIRGVEFVKEEYVRDQVDNQKRIARSWSSIVQQKYDTNYD
ncbi:MAG: hypothetical protein ACE5R6_07150 [Candidatus Heimdallarchaeota archaeon]